MMNPIWKKRVTGSWKHLYDCTWVTQNLFGYSNGLLELNLRRDYNDQINHQIYGITAEIYIQINIVIAMP